MLSIQAVRGLPRLRAIHCSLQYIFLQATPLFPHGVREMDMGWVWLEWVELGWVGSHFPAHVMGWVGLNEKYCCIVAEHCKTYFSLPLIFTFMSNYFSPLNFAVFAS